MYKNLKVRNGQHKSYPVVITSGDGSDVKLTRNNIVDIVRTAIHDKLSLVKDVYSPELSNSFRWIKVAQVDTIASHVYLEKTSE